ncbi:MAG: metalloregulator ArsR/SmtB family transcription factor [Candidatus Promineifilaceae bacterium]|jgi:ArsR family transcriptional regulator
MNKINYEENLNQRADLFKALGHPARLLILNLTRMQPRHGEELAAILGLTPATVSHHLSKLADAGLLTSKKEQYYQMYAPVDSVLDKTLDEMVRLPQPGLTENVVEDAYRKKVLKTFIKNGRLVQIPAQYKKRMVIIEYLVQEFEPGRQYPEREVNHILLDFNEDVATLRREMIDHKLMKREKGIYERIV